MVRPLRRPFALFLVLAFWGSALQAQAPPAQPSLADPPAVALPELIEPEPASLDKLFEMLPAAELPPPPPNLRGEVARDLETLRHDIPIPLNSRVLAYIALYQGRLRDFIEEGLRRSGRYLPMIQSVFRAEGLPLDLAYVPLIESAFKPNALSRAKARGVWQFMAGTATLNGLRRDWYFDERSDPEKSTQAAAKYLRTLADKFDGDWHLALASYNGGPGRVERAMARTGADDFWALAARSRVLPRETREYVPMVLAAMIVAKNPAQYGFHIEPERPPAYETVMLTRPVDLHRIAEWAGTTTDEIRALNPELRRWTTPVKVASYELRVPAGTAEPVAAHVAAADALALDLVSLSWYTVRKGDTLTSVARRLGVTRTDLAEANYVRTTARLSVGQKLIVPRDATLAVARAARPAAPSSAARTAASRPAPAAASTADRAKVLYRVKRGDTLFSIARQHQTTVAALKDWNNLATNLIKVGQRLTIYT
jgi:membrane-bound lytic murein transglycosylase D